MDGNWKRPGQRVHVGVGEGLVDLVGYVVGFAAIFLLWWL